MKKKKAIIVLADGFEEVEAVSPIDVLERTGVQVVKVGVSSREVSGSHGIKILADMTLDKISGDFDAVILPGGSPGAENLSKSDRVKDFIKDMHEEGKIVAAICASPAVVLAPTGILDGKKAACYPGMEKLFSKRIKYADKDVVIDGNIITSKGPGTALLFGFAIATKLVGKAAAESAKRRMLA